MIGFFEIRNQKKSATFFLIISVVFVRGVSVDEGYQSLGTLPETNSKST